jgi:hypothetical protein
MHVPPPPSRPLIIRALLPAQTKTNDPHWLVNLYGRINETEEWRRRIPRMGVITLFIDPAMLYTTLILFTADPFGILTLFASVLFFRFALQLPNVFKIALHNQVFIIF